jgi:hypothetical protein
VRALQQKVIIGYEKACAERAYGEAVVSWVVPLLMWHVRCDTIKKKRKIHEKDGVRVPLTEE